MLNSQISHFPVYPIVQISIRFFESKNGIDFHDLLLSYRTTIDAAGTNTKKMYINVLSIIVVTEITLIVSNEHF
ncbi:hypothetical protein DERF_004251 [Dermatophagoides farinae]|uniref:Uncharacterized protein n=1 Tax=Dermatophagoides farinae TaxID=6954 RepID=A0A922I6X7_DERFA|nr:hypothetical protein DERF_004251 [Dermatophagoides farinae]